jgi:hypothetical protein
MLWRVTMPNLSAFAARLRPATLTLGVLVAIAACGKISQATVASEPTALSSAQEAIALDMDLPAGDAEAGFTSALRYRCLGCHADPEHANYGPRFESSADIPAISGRGELRTRDPNYEGVASTDREYIIESVVLPEAYVVEGEWEEEMPTYFKDIISDQDLADIIAWMGTFK